MGVLIASAVIGATASIVGSLVASNQAKKATSRAGRKAERARSEIARIKSQRINITNPYAGNTDLSGLAKDLSSMITNPFANLAVATQAAEIQMEQSDIALANAFDTLVATGASAGGATALAQAALASKKGVAANIEQQEARNESAKAEGESRMQQVQMSEQQRVQGVQIAEGQRLQSQEGAGKQFEIQMEENRTNADLGRAAGQEQQAMQNEASANAAQSAAWGAAVTGVAGAAGNVAANTP